MKNTQENAETVDIRIFENKLVLKAPCPACGVLRIATVHKDGDTTIMCRCKCSHNGPAIADVFVVDPSNVIATTERRGRYVTVPRDH